MLAFIECLNDGENFGNRVYCHHDADQRRAAFKGNLVAQPLKNAKEVRRVDSLVALKVDLLMASQSVKQLPQPRKASSSAWAMNCKPGYDPIVGDRTKGGGD